MSLRIRSTDIWRQKRTFLIFRSAEQLHNYSLDGMVEDRVWRGFERQLLEVANLPGVREWWDTRGAWFSDEFQKYIAAIIAAGSPVEPQSYLGDSCRKSREPSAAEDPA
jgi:hypothetical protein